jgi:hypothetical protein
LNKEYGNKRFYEILDNLAELYNNKNKQYASKVDTEGNFHRCTILCQKLLKGEIKNKSLAYLLILMSKQIDAVYDIVGEGKENTVEHLEDKLKDVAVYSIIAMILIEEYEEKKGVP